MPSSDWHLNKTVTIGNILAITTAILALVGSYYTLDKRISVVEETNVHLVAHIKAEQTAREKDIKRVCDRLDRIENLILQVHFNKGKE